MVGSKRIPLKRKSFLAAADLGGGGGGGLYEVWTPFSNYFSKDSTRLINQSDNLKNPKIHLANKRLDSTSNILNMWHVVEAHWPIKS